MLADGEPKGSTRNLDRKEAAGMLANAVKSWRYLSTSAASGFYRPFTDRLRMGTNHFKWADQLQQLITESKRFDGTPTEFSFDYERPSHWTLGTGQGVLSWSAKVPGLAHCVVTLTDSKLSGEMVAWLLEKPLPSSTFFHKRAMTREGDQFVLDIPRAAAGHLIAAEIQWENMASRIPNWSEGRPYLVVPALAWGV